MRTTIPGLPSPYPIGLTLPALYLEDEFVQRFVAGLDEVIAPILLTLDCLDAYFDPALAPDDFVHWLAGWVAAPVDDGWPAQLSRQAVREAVELHRWRGTRRGLTAELRLHAGGEVELSESGAVSWSATAGSEPPGTSPATVRVRVRVPPEQSDSARLAPGPGPDSSSAAVDQRRLAEVVTQAVPAHVRVIVDVVED